MIYSIHQPNFIPWIGYFHKILSSDQVIFFDSVQFSMGKSYTSRVKILLQGKEHWLSLPVKKSGKSGQKICEVEILDFKHDWKKALTTVKHAYQKAPAYKEIAALLESYLEMDFQFLADLNIDLIKNIVERVSSQKIKFLRSSTKPELMTSNDRLTDYILNTCEAFGVRDYLSGRGASAEFLDKERFAEKGIRLTFQDFTHPNYQQNHTDTFVPGLSILDILMMRGFSGTGELLKNNNQLK